MPGSKAFGTQNEAEDGCKLDSKGERIVHDTIVAAGLTHRTHPALDDGRGGKSDFLVLGVYVEVWGLDDPDYKARRSKKLEYYVAHNLPLVEFEPEDFQGKARTVRSRVQEILRKARGRQEKLRGVKVPEMRDLNLDEILIAESMARVNGELSEIDPSLTELTHRIVRAQTALKELQDELQVMAGRRYEIIKRWLGDGGVD